MRPGPLEIVLIIFIIIAAAVIARMVRTGRRRDGEKGAAAPEKTGGNPDRFYWLFNRTGIGLTIVGFLALVAAFGMFCRVLARHLRRGLHHKLAMYLDRRPESRARL